MSHRIENHARELATMLDNGQGAQVAQILRNDLYNMSECDFSKLVHATNKYEKDGWGDDLTINPYRQKGGPKEHVSVELNRRDEHGLPIVYAETIQSWGNWHGHKPKAIETNRLIARDGWEPYEAPMQRAGHHNWNSFNHYQDLRYQRRYQEFQPFETRRESLRLEDIIVPSVLGFGLGLFFAQRGNRHHGRNFHSRPYYGPHEYYHAPNHYRSYNYHQRRFW